MGKTSLLQCPHFCRLSSQTRSKVYALAQHRCPNSGESLLVSGEYWLTMIWVRSGALRLFTIDENLNENNIAFFSDNEFLWPVTKSLRNQPSPFHIESVTLSELWIWPYVDFKDQFSDEVEWNAFYLPWVEALQNTKSRGLKGTP